MTGERTPFSLSQKLGLGAIAFIGTAVYAWSFRIAPGGEALFELARRIGVSAAISWIALGAVLLAIGRRSTMECWVDRCLSTMAIGIALMMLGAMYNALSRFLWPGAGDASVLTRLHAAVLLASDVSMGSWFVVRSSPEALSRSAAISAWVFGLNGVFAVCMAVLP